MFMKIEPNAPSTSITHMHEDYLGYFLFVSFRVFLVVFSLSVCIMIFIGPAAKSKDSDIYIYKKS